MSYQQITALNPVQDSYRLPYSFEALAYQKARADLLHQFP